MSTEFPSDPREALEASLTALLLGELPEDQAAFVRQAMAQDADLARRFERLKRATEMIRLAESAPTAPPLEPPATLKFSERRRQLLLQSFKTVAPAEFAPPPRPKFRWVIPAGIAALLLAVLGVALLPALSRSKSRGMASFSAALDKRDLRRALAEDSKQPAPGDMLKNQRDESPAAEAKPAIRSSQPQTQIILPAGEPEPAASAPEVAGKEIGQGLEGRLRELRAQGLSQPSSQSHGLGGGGGDGGLASKTPEKSSSSGDPLQDAAGARHSFLQRYGLAGGGVGGAMSSGAPAQSVAEYDKLNRPVLGDQPSLGLLFQRTGDAPQDAENRQSAGARSSNSADFGLLTQGIRSNGLSTNGDQEKLTVGRSWASSASLRGFYDDAGAKGALTSNTFQPDALPLFGSATTANNGLIAKGENSPVTSDRSKAGEDLKKDYNAATRYREVANNLNSYAYEEKTHELLDLQRSNQMLLAKIASEGSDLTMPKSGMVRIVDQAMPAQSPKQGFLDRVMGRPGGNFESVARLRVDGEKAEWSTQSTGPEAYDPYFLKSEFEVIRSDLVLGRVVEKLNLGEVWAKRKGSNQPMGIDDAIKMLRQNLEFQVVKGTDLMEIRAKDDQAKEAADIANAVAEEYTKYRDLQARNRTEAEVKSRRAELQIQQNKIAGVERELERLRRETNRPEADTSPPKSAPTIPTPQPEVATSENALSTFSLNVSDVSFKLAAASLEKGLMPERAGIRAEEFINAFDYRDPEPAPGAPFAFAWERTSYPFAHNRDLLRLSLKTASQGRQAGRPLNLVLLLDNSGSMERADRVRIIHEALRVLADQLGPQDTLSVVTFARTARLLVNGVPGDQAQQVVEQISGLTPEGGTNLEEAMNLGYQTALNHYRAEAINRVVLLTDGAANLGNVSASWLTQKVEAHRKQGIALDCFGIGWDGYNDDLLETLARNGDGRYGFLNTPEEAASGFAGQLAGALRVAAGDVKVQVQFNPNRVTAYRQVGYATHQLTAAQFRDNTVDAAEMGAAESGNALYVLAVDPAGSGDLATVRVRFKVPGSAEYKEMAWTVPYTGRALALTQSGPAMRLAATAGAFAEWLASNPYAAEVTPKALLGLIKGVPAVFGADNRPQKLEWMLQQAQGVSGR